MIKDIIVKKREWVKTAAIVFLAVMLVLTFFSNTIMNRSLPEVAAQYTQSATISSRIRGSGTVVANEIYEVVTEHAYTVSEVRVKTGDTVLAGDLLIVLSQSGSMELEMAEEELRTAEQSLQEFLLTASPDNDYASFYRDVQNAQDELTYAQKMYEQRENEHTLTLREAASAGYSSDVYANATSKVRAAQLKVEQKEAEEAIARNNLDTYVATYTGSGEVEDQKAYKDLLKKQNSAIQATTDAQNALIALQIDLNFSALTSISERLQAAEDGLAEADRTLKSAQQMLDVANENLATAQKTAGQANSLFNIQVKNMNNNIAQLREKVEQLRDEGSVTEMTAPVSGRITEINISPGQQSVPNNPLMVIELLDRGYTLSIPVTSAQSTKVSIGDMAEVDRGWWSWGEPLSAVLTAIRPDPQNPSGGRLLVFTVNGSDIENGMQLNVTVNQRSEDYGIVVPNIAIRSDTNGEFVLIVEEQSSPLRNRYVATRVDIQIIAQDDISSAISGAGLTGYDFVITTSTRPIESGMQVRLVDN